MRRVQADQRVIGRSEEIGLYCQALVVDEVIPLPRRRDQKDRPQQHGGGQIEARNCADCSLRSALTAK